jgi:hypothetical protein
VVCITALRLTFCCNIGWDVQVSGLYLEARLTAHAVQGKQKVMSCVAMVADMLSGVVCEAQRWMYIECIDTDGVAVLLSCCCVCLLLLS